MIIEWYHIIIGAVLFAAGYLIATLVALKAIADNIHKLK